MPLWEVPIHTKVGVEELQDDVLKLLTMAQSYSIGVMLDDDDDGAGAAAGYDLQRRIDNYVRRERVRITDFLCEAVVWLGAQRWPATRTCDAGPQMMGRPASELPPCYVPLRTDADSHWPSEMISIRRRILELNGRLMAMTTLPKETLAG